MSSKWVKLGFLGPEKVSISQIQNCLNIFPGRNFHVPWMEVFQKRGTTVSQIFLFLALPFILRSGLYQATSIVNFAQGYKTSDFGRGSALALCENRSCARILPLPRSTIDWNAWSASYDHSKLWYHKLLLISLELIHLRNQGVFKRAHKRTGFIVSGGAYNRMYFFYRLMGYNQEGLEVGRGVGGLRRYSLR